MKKKSLKIVLGDGKHYISGGLKFIAIGKLKKQAKIGDKITPKDKSTELVRIELNHLDNVSTLLEILNKIELYMNYAQTLKAIGDKQ